MEKLLLELKEIDEQKARLIKELKVLQPIEEELVEKIEKKASKRIYSTLSIPSELLLSEYRYNTIRKYLNHSFFLEITIGGIGLGLYTRLISESIKDGVVLKNDNINWVNIYTEGKKASEIANLEDVSNGGKLKETVEFGSYATETILINKSKLYEIEMYKYLRNIKEESIKFLKNELNGSPIFNHNYKFTLIRDGIGNSKIDKDFKLIIEENCIGKLCDNFEYYIETIIRDIRKRDFVLFEENNSKEDIELLHKQLDKQESLYLAYKLNEDLANNLEEHKATKI